jgi:hypothetical protein
MADALLKFKAGKLIGKRYTPTKEQGQILALTAQVEQLKSAKQLSKKVPNESPHKPKTPRNDNKWAWKDTFPKVGDPTTKLFEGKQYHLNFTFHPSQWACHSSQECNKNRRLKPVKLVAAMLVEENDSGDDSQGDNYGMAGWRAFFALCWPLHQCLNNGSFPSL